VPPIRLGRRPRAATPLAYIADEDAPPSERRSSAEAFDRWYAETRNAAAQERRDAAAHEAEQKRLEAKAAEERRREAEEAAKAAKAAEERAKAMAQAADAAEEKRRAEEGGKASLLTQTALEASLGVTLVPNKDGTQDVIYNWDFCSRTVTAFLRAVGAKGLSGSN
jgi:hypothetical protein